MRQQRLNEYGTWLGDSKFASRNLIVMCYALRGESVSEESISEITNFFQSCKKGEKALLMSEMKQVGLENVDKYWDIFRPSAKVLDTEYYLRALGKVEEGDKNSIKGLKDFFSGMMRYCLRQASKCLIS